MSIKSVDTNIKSPAWETTVRRAVENLRYGSVEVLVHDGRVVQVETRQKVRIAGRRRPDERERNHEPQKPADRESGGTASEETNE